MILITVISIARCFTDKAKTEFEITCGDVSQYVIFNTVSVKDLGGLILTCQNGENSIASERSKRKSFGQRFFV